MSARNSSKKKEPKAKKESKVKEKKGKEKVTAKVPKAKVKVPADKYTLILLFSLLALIAAAVMVYLDLQSYK